MTPKLSDKELGIVQAVLNNFNENQLPKLLTIKERVDSGEKLSSADIRLLDELIRMNAESEPFVDSHPEFGELIARAASLYHDITEKALENEKADS